MKESEVQKFILDYCGMSSDLFAVRLNIGAMKSKGGGFFRTVRTSHADFKNGVGLSDVIVFFSGTSKALFLECKTDALTMAINEKNQLKTNHYIGALSEEQRDFKAYCEKSGFHHSVVYCPDDFIKAVERVREST